MTIFKENTHDWFWVELKMECIKLLMEGALPDSGKMERIILLEGTASR